MNKSLILWVVVVSLLTSGPLVRAGEAARMCKFDKFAKVVEPTPKQRKAMEGVLAETDRKLAAWSSANASKESEIAARLGKMRGARQAALRLELMTKRVALRAERAKITKPCMGRLIALLDTKQRILWQGHLLAETMLSSFRRFQLDAGQITDVRTRCNLTAKAIAELPGTGKILATSKIKRKLAQDIVLEVLTSIQRTSIVGVPGKNETRAQRTQRLKLAAMGFAGKRLGEDIDRSQKAVQLAVDNNAKQMASMKASGLASGQTSGARELMDRVNQARSNAGVPKIPGHTKLNTHAQEIADYNEGRGKKDRSHPWWGYLKTGYGNGVWVRGSNTPESALNRLLYHTTKAYILSPSYTAMGVARRGKTWAVMLNSGMKDDGLIEKK